MVNEAKERTARRLVVSRQYNTNGGVRETSDEDLIEVPVLPEGSAAEVSYGRGATVNLGNYESARIDVRISLPCPIAELEPCYETAKRFVEDKIADELNELRL